MILETMLQRLFASLVHGPSMNARPHRSRQRCDWMELLAFQGINPVESLGVLLEKRKMEFPAKVAAFAAPSYPEAEWSVEQKLARDAFQKQSKLLKKLRDMADDALEYMNDHGESCLALGFPLISMPPAGEEKSGRSSSRVLAPLFLMPVQLQVRTASRMGVTVECMGEGADLLVANPALIAWLERQTGKTLEEVYIDEDASDPWREVGELLSQLYQVLGLEGGANFGADTLLETVPALEKLPRSVTVLNSAVLGLFPLSNQSLLRDTRWMLDNQTALEEPVAAFLNPKALHEVAEPEGQTDAEVEQVRGRDFSAEWLVSNADPCQANAVLASREAKALVVHGPPGTGKSQTIMNMIADHLARGERVLFVCDKRTALDVVKYRLDAVGLGEFCGVVHDPSGDRKDFYMGLRSRLENLADVAPVHDPRAKLGEVNRQLAAIHSELEGYRQQLHGMPEDGTAGFHDLLGQWLKLTMDEEALAMEAVQGLELREVEAAATTVDEICRRAEKVGYPSNSFRGWLGIDLGTFLAKSNQEVLSGLAKLDEAGTTADELRPAEMVGRVEVESDLEGQAKGRDEVAQSLKELSVDHDGDFVQLAVTLPQSRRSELEAELPEVNRWLSETSGGGLDRTMLSGLRSAGLLSLAPVNQSIAVLSAWELAADSFFKRLLAGKVKKEATAALAPLGLGLDAGWKQGLAFFKGLKSRLLVADWLGRLGNGEGGLLDDVSLQTRVRVAETVWKTQASLAKLGAGEKLAEAAGDVKALQALAKAMEAEAVWLRALDEVGLKMKEGGLFTAEAITTWMGCWAAGQAVQETTGVWSREGSTVEDMVRLKHSLASLPAGIAQVVEALIGEGLGTQKVMDALRRMAIESVLKDSLKRDPSLASIDAQRIEAAFENFQRLAREKLQLVADYVKYLWLHHQRDRLLATTGSQLNKLGSGLRQRLYVRGKKALKLRQMLATGAEVEGGDPIYDLCPVWMASPSTVAQIFPRHAIFDVVIFDEASQCRLEEALPVLMRGHRVVIAGDQKQLPPTRFFESALADSGDGDAETAEELFYQQQQEAEDLLSAALNLDVREAYLDVHYRSRNEALIGFSNEHYYGSRLQPIPGHPRNKALDTPIRLHAVNGVYRDRTNVMEAEAAVNLIAELLAEPEPPSIGVACFNLTQKEAIHEAIATRVDGDAVFARRYEEAKQRKGRDSFEGLFVKNLENVQGDERDVMIISTTFGPDAAGKFRRNFGALSQREGGRRLNVLVTRARDAVHVLTSIPAAEYAAVEAVPPGQIPNGRLQLYAYLRYAEKLAAVFENYQDELEKMRRDCQPELKVWESATPSPLAVAIGETMLERHGAGNHVYWGNEGFCVDVACMHPLMPADVTVGVLADFSRFHKTPDPIEWDIFRTGVLRSQGWELERVWSPVLFRRAEESLQRIKERHDQLSKPSAVGTELKSNL